MALELVQKKPCSNLSICQEPLLPADLAEAASKNSTPLLSRVSEN
jgi:hypothetical protein